MPHINLVAGDFNYGGGIFDFYKTLSTTPFDSEIANIFEQNFLTQLIDIPTRYQTTINGHSVSLIDHIWIDRVDLLTKASVCSQISDGDARLNNEEKQESALPSLDSGERV